MSLYARDKVISLLRAAVLKLVALSAYKEEQAELNSKIEKSI